jgi:hypothetical protein
MNTVREKSLSLTVRFGSCQRYTETDGKLSRRSIRFRDCPILNCGLKGEDQPARGDEIELWVHEGDTGQEAIGSFDTLGFLQLSLPPAAFAEFWTAGAAADGAARDITILFEKGELPFYWITKAQLVEHMPEAIDFDAKAHAPGYISGRLHPVVAELREMRRALAGSWRGIVTAFLVIGAFVLVVGVISSALQALWKLLSS